jgi:ribonucleoside-diphosphate reductase alpha chain
MDSLATSVSLALQYGVPLRDLVNKFAHVRFEPSGFTGNQEIPIAKSIVDYVFRWMGSRFLPTDERAQIGLIDRGTVVDSAPISFGAVSLAVAPESDAPAAAEADDDRVEDRPTAVAVESAPISINLPVVESVARTANGNGHAPTNAPATGASLGTTRVAFRLQEDAPSCAECGSIMVRNGSCYKCLNCGSTSGCS